MYAGLGTLCLQIRKGVLKKFQHEQYNAADNCVTVVEWLDVGELHG